MKEQELKNNTVHVPQLNPRQHKWHFWKINRNIKSWKNKFMNINYQIMDLKKNTSVFAFLSETDDIHLYLMKNL